MANTAKAAKSKKSTRIKSKSAHSGQNADIFLKVQGIIAHQLKSQPSRITLRSHMQNDLGADSLDALEVLNQVEEDFDVKVSEEDARKMATVQDIVDHLTKIIEPSKKR